ncbi:MAG: hypothetical protein Fur0018_19780 [Anaerolineales bacterium]
MSIWQTYPASYRSERVQRIIRAVRAGACVNLVGLSGAGKSNLLGFLAHRPDVFPFPVILVDGNRLEQASAPALLRLMCRALNCPDVPGDALRAVEDALSRRLTEPGASLCILFDRFDPLAGDPISAANLRALRDAFKYRLTFVLATRRPLPPDTELAELVFGQTIYLGALSQADARWNVARFAARFRQPWEADTGERICALSGNYPALLKAVCEALADGTPLDETALRRHPAIRLRVDEFWRDAPPPALLHACGLENLPLLQPSPPAPALDPARFTQKEYLLLTYLQAHPGEVCGKDELIPAVWPEDAIYDRGVRDDSLAQMVRRLRLKIEPDPSNPVHLLTVPGRGYRFMP